MVSYMQHTLNYSVHKFKGYNYLENLHMLTGFTVYSIASINLLVINLL